jgi:hypothetical protein
MKRLAELGFLLMHAAVGGCPPVVVWRPLGVRTKHEVELERSLLGGALGLGLRAGELVSGNSVKPPAPAS